MELANYVLYVKIKIILIVIKLFFFVFKVENYLYGFIKITVKFVLNIYLKWEFLDDLNISFNTNCPKE